MYVFNHNMSWKTHLDKLGNRLSKTAGVLNRIKRLFPLNIMRTLYHSMVQSYLIYGIVAWGFESARISKVQKKIIRIIVCGKYNAHTEPIFKALEILNINDMFNLHALKFYYKYLNSKLPVYFLNMQFIPLSEIHPYNTRYNDHIPTNVTRLKMSQNCVRNYISKILANTPENIMQKIYTHSLHGFSNYTKRQYLANYQELCDIENCYVCGRT